MIVTSSTIGPTGLHHYRIHSWKRFKSGFSHIYYNYPNGFRQRSDRIPTIKLLSSSAYLLLRSVSSVRMSPTDKAAYREALANNHQLQTWWQEIYYKPDDQVILLVFSDFAEEHGLLNLATIARLNANFLQGSKQ